MSDRTLRRLALAAALAVLPCSAARAGDEEPAAGPPPGPPALERLAAGVSEGSAEGLPTGAIARMGGSAWRVPAGVTDARLSADASRLVLVSDGLFTVMDTRDGRVVARLGWRGEALTDWAVSRDGSVLALLADGVVHAQSTESDLVRRSVPTGPDGPKPQALALSADGRSWVVAGGGRLALWEAEGVVASARAEEPSGARSVTSAAFLAGEATVAVGYGDGSVTLWTPSQPGAPRRVQLVEIRDMDGAGFVGVLGTPTADHLAVQFVYAQRVTDPSPLGPDTDTVRGVLVWDVKEGKAVARKVLHYARYKGLAFAADGGSVAEVQQAGAADGVQEVKVYDLTLGEPLRRARMRNPSVQGLLHSNGVTYLGLTEAGVRPFDVAKGAFTDGPRGHVDPVTALAFAPKGDRLVSGDKGGRGVLWDARSGEPLAALPPHRYGPLTCLRFDGEGTAITYHASGAIHVIEAATGKAVSSADISYTPDVGVVSPDGKRLVLGRMDRIVSLDAATGRVLREAHLDRGSVRSLAATPDFRTFVIGGTDGTVSLLALDGEAPPRPLTKLPGHGEGVMAVSISADGGTVAAFSYDKHKVHVLDGATGKVRREIDPDEWWLHPSQLALSPDGRRLLVGHDALRLYDAESGTVVATLAIPSKVTVLAVDPSWNTVATAHEDARVLVWRLPAVK